MSSKKKRIELPANNWRPRPYQFKAWDYLQSGGKHAELIWHRRSGKDEVALHHTACASQERPATYWHCLPLQTQARKAIWEAVNPHTGKRRIDEVFPKEMRLATRENEMFLKLLNGSTWQVVGSDNYEAHIGSPPAGIVYSEWAQSNPAARAYLRPILAENHGWQIFITTPRGKNHAYKTYTAAKQSRGAFAELLTALETNVFTSEELKAERASFIEDFGLDMGEALYDQEYLCSFEAAILGAYYGSEFNEIDKQNRICAVPHDPEFPVFTAWDIGYDDDTAIWWYQVIRGEIRVLECYFNSLKNVDHYCEQILGREVQIHLDEERVWAEVGATVPGLEHRRKYRYERHWLPHDAEAKTLAAKGKSVVEQLAAALGGFKNMGIVPTLSVQDGIQAARQTLKRCWFDFKCEDGIDALRSYQREWDETRKMFRDRPRHDWASHFSDAFRYLSIAWRHPRKEPEKEKGKTIHDMSLNELWEAHEKYIRRPERI